MTYLSCAMGHALLCVGTAGADLVPVHEADTERQSRSPSQPDALPGTW